MNTRLSIMIAALVGGTIGYLAADWYVVTKMTPQDDGDYEDTEEFPQDLEDENMLVEEITMEPIQMGKQKKSARSAPVRDYAGIFDKKGMASLSALASKYKTDEPVEDQPELIETEAEEAYDPDMDPDLVVEEPEQDPSVISFSEYLNEDEALARVTLHYYTEDDVVTDDKNNPIRNPESFLGDDALVSFGEESGDPDTVYVRNRQKKALYEIAQHHKPFAQTTKRQRAPLTPKKEDENEDVNQG